MPVIQFILTSLCTWKEVYLLLGRTLLNSDSADTSVTIQTQDEAQANLLNNLLWTEDTRFIPHALSNTAVASKTPIVIHFTKELPLRDHLINLAHPIPSEYYRFKRITEIVCEINKQEAREHYRFYKSAGFSVKSLHAT